MDDHSLLDGVCTGDKHAFRRLMTKYYDALYVFAFRLLHDGRSAEDAVQDAFMHVWIARKQLSAVDSLKNYLYGIVRNRCMLALRSSRNHDKYLRTIAPAADDTLSIQTETETMRLLDQAIGDLPPRSGEVIRLSLEGLRQDDIARQMEITVATVKFLKADAIKKLRKTLLAIRCLLVHL